MSHLVKIGFKDVSKVAEYIDFALNQIATSPSSLRSYYASWYLPVIDNLNEILRNGGYDSWDCSLDDALARICQSPSDRVVKFWESLAAYDIANKERG